MAFGVHFEHEVVSALQKKGIDALFAIQAQTLDTALSGKDIVGRARTGCGKTLAFVLPIVEQINKSDPTPALQQQRLDVDAA